MGRPRGVNVLQLSNDYYDTIIYLRVVGIEMTVVIKLLLNCLAQISKPYNATVTEKVGRRRRRRRRQIVLDMVYLYLCTIIIHNNKSILEHSIHNRIALAPTHTPYDVRSSRYYYIINYYILSIIVCIAWYSFVFDDFLATAFARKILIYFCNSYIIIIICVFVYEREQMWEHACVTENLNFTDYSYREDVQNIKQLFRDESLAPHLHHEMSADPQEVILCVGKSSNGPVENRCGSVYKWNLWVELKFDLSRKFIP